MVALRIALRSLMRRKVRMILIGSLVLIGTFLLVFGGTFAASAKSKSKEAIINYFTGDLVLYSVKSKDLPSPFSFTTPLPVIERADELQTWLARDSRVASYVGIAQNFGLMSIQRNGVKMDIPFTFYAVDPERYRATFDNLEVTKGSWYGGSGSASDSGVMISESQAARYLDKYGITLEPGEAVTLLSLTGGGSVNATPSHYLGTFQARHFSNVFNYISILDIATYSRLYNFTGVAAGSLPKEMEAAFGAISDEDIFGLGEGQGFDSLDVGALKQETLTGYTMINVKLKDASAAPALLADLAAAGFTTKSAAWNQASSFFASIADILQGVIFGITLLIFLVVVLILMNTMIINILERTGEIGTLRAIGADKSFVSSIFLWESLILNFSAALLGIAFSVALIFLAGQTGLQLPDLVSQYLIGGGTLRLEPSIMPIASGLVLVLAVSFLATLYPTRVATSVSPLKAISGK